MIEVPPVLNVVLLVALLAVIALVVYLFSVHEKLGRIATALEAIAAATPPAAPGPPRSEG